MNKFMFNDETDMHRLHDLLREEVRMQGCTEFSIEGGEIVMGREIKFRAWNKVLKSMFNPDEMSEYITFDGHVMNIALVGYWGTVHIHNDDRTDTYELMQYTGLRDKNGVEIYEGDIVQSDNGQVGTVTLESTYLACVVRWSVECVRFFDEEYDSFIGDVVRHCKVIGNIYENADMFHTPV